MVGLSRAQLLGGLAASAIVAPLGLRPAGAAARADSGDVALLNTAAGLERAAIKMYGDAVAAQLVSVNVATVTNQFSNDHTAQLAALVALLQQDGETPSSDTTVLQTPAMKTEADFLAFALSTERQLASSYLAAVPQFKNRDLAKTAASILGVDTAHVAVLSEALRQYPPYPGGFVS
jgi:hypothetical protein